MSNLRKVSNIIRKGKSEKLKLSMAMVLVEGKMELDIKEKFEEIFNRIMEGVSEILVDGNETVAESNGSNINIGTTACVKDGSKEHVSGVSKTIISNVSNDGQCLMIRELDHGEANAMHKMNEISDNELGTIILPSSGISNKGRIVIRSTKHQW